MKMNLLKTLTYFQTESGFVISRALGYSTKGTPGLELIGLGKNEKILKQKLIFYVKSLGIKVPHLRYFLILDEGYLGNRNDVGKMCTKNCEIAFLILWLGLMGVINIYQLDNFILVGQFNTDGRFFSISKEIALKVIIDNLDSHWGKEAFSFLMGRPLILCGPFGIEKSSLFIDLKEKLHSKPFSISLEVINIKNFLKESICEVEPNPTLGESTLKLSNHEPVTFKLSCL